MGSDGPTAREPGRGGGGAPNRLAHETSPYLLQHAHNPVDWYPWGPEALERARREDRPILLSIGYAACHWCHVMERESFEDPETAALMNDHFVSIKVDREERPDLDGIYMEAVQAMAGHGGWPMTVFLTPEGEPFFAGTYFPDQDRHGMPSFRRVLTAIAEAWRDRREEARGQARRVLE
ncbi:MAG: thioredoxin domain-containing protein, partial [Actinobacteria bacterium]|nr:thioredoxin domain-containing protein [Actinomycetota bacterium]